MRRVIPLLVTLMTSMASAQDDTEGAIPDGYSDEDYEREAAKRLEGTSRVSIIGGWRYAPNFTFYDNYYFKRDNRALERSRGAIGGPLLTGTFAYSVTELIEVGIDLFTTYERMELTNKPGLNAVTFGALVGLRFQKRLELGNRVVIPSVGALFGPIVAASYFDGGQSVERGQQALGFTGGATLKLSKQWGLCFELRYLFASGDVKDVGPFNAGGTWLGVGMTYSFPWQNENTRIHGKI
ncbi:hypothetical protein [Hyalangium versicolor]|uniref:hypothetical protein n=1 Tax=Hyalangium versicolor TaxID=2861190 RepID=UPI001CC95795|nr:hypothetical protein [Hyalangium versicolor]